MKKFLVFSLYSLLFFSFYGCDDDDAAADDGGPQVEKEQPGSDPAKNDDVLPIENNDPPLGNGDDVGSAPDDGGDGDSEGGSDGDVDPPPSDSPGSPIFDGLVGVEGVSQRSAVLQWVKHESAVSYTLFKIIDGAPRFIRHISSRRNYLRLSNLSPTTEYQYILRMMTTEGVMDENLNILSFSTLAYPEFINSVALRTETGDIRGPSAMAMSNRDRSFSVSFWAKTGQLQNDTRLINFHNEGGNGTAVNVHTTGDGIAIGLRTVENSYVTYSHDFNYADEQWHFYVLTFHHSRKRFELYIDGQKAISEISSRTPMGNRGIQIGSYDGQSRHFQGLIDEIAIWKGVRSGAQVLTLFNDGQASQILQESFYRYAIAWWRGGDLLDQNAAHSEMTSVIGTHKVNVPASEQFSFEDLVVEP